MYYRSSAIVEQKPIWPIDWSLSAQRARVADKDHQGLVGGILFSWAFFSVASGGHLWLATVPLVVCATIGIGIQWHLDWLIRRNQPDNVKARLPEFHLEDLLKRSNHRFKLALSVAIATWLYQDHSSESVPLSSLAFVIVYGVASEIRAQRQFRLIDSELNSGNYRSAWQRW